MAGAKGDCAFLDSDSHSGAGWTGEPENKVMNNVATALNIDDMPTRVLVIGLGKTGLSCVRYLHDLGVPQLAVADSRQQPPGLQLLREQLPDVGLFLGDFDPEMFAGAEMLVVSPGVPMTTPAIQYALDKGVQVVGDIELFARYVQAAVAVITGSNGKSTVTTLLGQMAAAVTEGVAVGGNLGEPVLDLLSPEKRLYVLELSSFQLETTYSLMPEVALVLNISADHMDRYADLADYSRIKSRVYDKARAGVYNLDDPLVMSMPGTREALFFTLGEPEGQDCFGVRQIDGESWLCRGQTPLMPGRELRMPGQHNLSNALAALAMGTVLELPLKNMLEVLRIFPGLEHRTEYVTEVNGITWYNDSKGTNPGASIAALQGLDGNDGSRTVLIAGGDCKQADFEELAEVMVATCRAVVLIGKDRDQIGKLVTGRINVAVAQDMAEAVELAAELAESGDRVLLSPACASFDMFDGFGHRGAVFKALVGELIQ
jgi:UDP-N-acetylmuramoylalanine--D-glutamate ligase